MKKKVPDFNPKNELVRELKDSEFVKNPLVYSQIRGDFTPMQTNVMVELVNTLQEKINEYLQQRKRTDVASPWLFSQEEMSGGSVTFTIPIKELGVSPNSYNELEQACYKLLKLDVVYTTKDDNTGEESIVMANIFSKIKFPTSDVSKEGIRYNYAGGKRRTGQLQISMLSENVSKVFDMRRGYVEHVRHIVSFCRKRQSPRVYIYLSKWKHVGRKSVNYMEFKEYLGLLRYNAKRTEVVQNKYEKFATFCAMVLNPIRDELNTLAEQNKIDFSFDYTPRYPVGKTKGDPDSIVFNIHLFGMGRARREQRQGIASRADLDQVLQTEYGLTVTDLMSLRELTTDAMLPMLQAEVKAMREKIETYHPRSVRAYVVQSLRNFLRQLAAQMPEEPEEAVVIEDTCTNGEPEEVRVSEEDRSMWELFLSMVKETISEDDYFKWFSETDIYNYRDHCLTMTVPTRYVMDYIEQNLLSQVRDALDAAFGDGCSLKYRIE